MLRSANPQAAHAGALVVAKIGALELQEKQWPELLGQLLKNMTTKDVGNSNLTKTSTLEALGYLCEDLEEEAVDQTETNQILTAIVDGMREDGAITVRVAAARALLSSLVFTRHNFDNETERTMIMQVLCTATKSPDEQLRIIAFESLARVAALYYEKLPQYIEALFTLTLTAIQQDKDEQVSMMAVEFWSSLCEEELEILEETNSVDQSRTLSHRQCARYVCAAASHIVPVLLQSTLVKQDEYADEDKALSVCLNAKMRRTGICGAVETILINKKIAQSFVPKLIALLSDANCEVRCCEETIGLDDRAVPATSEDWSTEYLAPIVSLKSVVDVEEAIIHIERYGTGHTESIISENKKNQSTFTNAIDSAIVMINASTQFADGGEFGLGGEIGIATGKFHARGPVGVDQLTSFKYIVTGDGQIRD